MKIDSTGPIRPSQSTQRLKSSSGTNVSSFAQHIQEEPPQATSQASGALGLETLWFLQEIGDQEERRRQAYRRGKSLLESLEQLRLAILSGTLSIAHLQHIRGLLATHKATIDDPQLQAIIADIELRARVELAKLERPDPA
jgi:hypothetical protein